MPREIRREWGAVSAKQAAQLLQTQDLCSRRAWVVGLSAVIGSLVPLAPFPFLPVGTSMWVSVLVTAFVLFAIGYYKAHITVGRPMRSGLEMTIIGTISALAGYAVGALLKVPAIP